MRVSRACGYAGQTFRGRVLRPDMFHIDVDALS
jgi:hypothetical protein